MAGGVRTVTPSSASTPDVNPSSPSRRDRMPRAIPAWLNGYPEPPSRFPIADGRARQSRRVRNQSIASISDGTRFRGRPDTTPALIEKRLDRRVLLNDCRFEFDIASHRGGVEHKTHQMKSNLGLCSWPPSAICPLPSARRLTRCRHRRRPIRPRTAAGARPDRFGTDAAHRTPKAREVRIKFPY